MATLQPGNVVAVDALTYPGFVLAQTLRLELAVLPPTDDGLDLDVPERLCATRRLRAVYAMPTMHNLLMDHDGEPPRATGRNRPQAWAFIVEDAAYAFLAEQAPPLVIAPETTVYVSGSSKSVATGLRFGFIAAPTTLVPAIERTIRATTWNTPAVMTAIACQWIDDGTVTCWRPTSAPMPEPRQSIARDAGRSGRWSAIRRRTSQLCPRRYVPTRSRPL